MVIIGGDLNGHAGKEVDGYDGVQWVIDLA